MSRSTTSERVTAITCGYDMLSLTSLALGARLIRISLTGLFVASGSYVQRNGAKQQEDGRVAGSGGAE